MNNSPGSSSPGPAPSDPEEPTTLEPAEGDDAQAVGAVHPPSDAAPNWSANQPPPGGPGWSAPPPPPSGPGPSYGSAFGHGYGRNDASSRPAAWSGPGSPPSPNAYGGYGPYGGPPPAAKPGVIPLRPLTVGDILDGAVATIRVNWRTVLGISLCVALVTQALNTLITGAFFRDAQAQLINLQHQSDVNPGHVLHIMGETFASSGATILLTVLGDITATAMLTVIVSRAVLGRSTTIREAWQDAGERIPRMVGLTLLMPIMAIGILVVALVPGVLLCVCGSVAAGVGLMVLCFLAILPIVVWLMIRFSLAAPALMLERQGIFAAMARSVKLVRGSWWRVFGILLLASLIVAIIGGVMEFPFSAIAMAVSGSTAQSLINGGGLTLTWSYLIIVGIGSVLGTTISFPLSAGVTVLLYIDQRIRREGLDIELGRSAGVPGYGAPSPTAQ